MSRAFSFRLCTYFIWSTIGIRMFRPCVCVGGGGVTHGKSHFAGIVKIANDRLTTCAIVALWQGDDATDLHLFSEKGRRERRGRERGGERGDEEIYYATNRV